MFSESTTCLVCHMAGSLCPKKSKTPSKVLFQQAAKRVNAALAFSDHPAVILLFGKRALDRILTLYHFISTLQRRIEKLKFLRLDSCYSWQHVMIVKPRSCHKKDQIVPLSMRRIRRSFLQTFSDDINLSFKSHRPISYFSLYRDM